MKSKKIIASLLDKAGIKINGNNPYDIQVHNEKLYDRVLRQGSLGLGESYMDGWWDCQKLDEFFLRIFKIKLDEKVSFNIYDLFFYSKALLFNMQSKLQSKKVAKEHYDLDNKLYESFLDPYNQYTCGYFKNTNDLNVAQEHKMDLICKKLKLKPEDKILDIGCGWGGFAKYASEHYKCHVTGVTISDEQYKYAKNFCKDLPIDILKKDYRDLKGKFDKILVCGMIEHVGCKNYDKFMKKVYSLLNNNGFFLLHTIGNHKSLRSTDLWIDKYIFPGGVIPSLCLISKAIQKYFTMEDWHNFGSDYDKTLMAWYQNFENNWNNIKSNYDDKFYKMWKYYLLSCAGSFRARKNQLWQIVLSKEGIPEGYKSIR